MTTLTVTAHKFRQIVTTTRLPVDVDAKLNLGKLKPRTRKTIINALRKGVYWGASGTQWAYVLVAKTCGVPWMTVQKINYKKETDKNGLALHPRIIIRYNRQPGTILEGILHGDKAASKLVGAIYTGTHTLPGEYTADVIYHVREKERVDAAGEERIAGYQASIEAAVQLLEQGESIILKHEPIPSKYQRRPKGA